MRERETFRQARRAIAEEEERRELRIWERFMWEEQGWEEEYARLVRELPYTWAGGVTSYATLCGEARRLATKAKSVACPGCRKEFKGATLDEALTSLNSHLANKSGQEAVKGIQGTSAAQHLAPMMFKQILATYKMDVFNQKKGEGH